MSVVADKLREARARIEMGWTQDAWARDAAGMAHMEDEPGVVCWCAGGAIFRVSDRHLTASDLIEFFRRANKLNSVAAWNDAPERTQAEVLAAFDKAIQLAEQGK